MKLYILTIPKRKSFETFLKIRNGFKVFGAQFENERCP